MSNNNYTLDELTTPVTALECESLIYGILAKLGIKTTRWRSGSVVRAIITVVATLMGFFGGLVANLAKMGFLETATGPWLTILAKGTYATARQQSTFATCYGVVTNGGVLPISFDAGDLIVRSSISGKTYKNVSAFSVNVGLTETIAIVATENGSSSNADIGDINQLVTSVDGASFANTTIALALDEESDESLRSRCRNAMAALSPAGPKAAYESRALGATLDNGTTAGVTRVQVLSSPSTGSVTVYVGGPSGALPGDVHDSSTPLGAVSKAIQFGVVPVGVTASVVSATPQTVSVTIDVWVKQGSGYSSSQVESLVHNNIASELSNAPIGGYNNLFALSQLISAAHSASSYIRRVLISYPTADIAVNDGRVLILGIIGVVVHFDA